MITIQSYQTTLILEDILNGFISKYKIHLATWQSNSILSTYVKLDLYITQEWKYRTGQLVTYGKGDALILVILPIYLKGIRKVNNIILSLLSTEL